MIRVLVVWVLVYAIMILLTPGFNRTLLSLVSSVGSPPPFVRQSILNPSPPSAAALSLLASLASHLFTHLYTTSFSLINTRLAHRYCIHKLRFFHIFCFLALEFHPLVSWFLL